VRYFADFKKLTKYLISAIIATLEKFEQMPGKGVGGFGGGSGVGSGGTGGVLGAQSAGSCLAISGFYWYLVIIDEK
jgi:hypothetical protein